MTIFIPIILAGGKGERFWPLSRLHHPKQFLSLDGTGKSLLQYTVDRLFPLAETWDNLWVITSALLETGVKQQLPHLPSANCLVEPQGKDTAPAVAWTTLEIAQRYGENAILGFFPADHHIPDQNTFEATLKTAIAFAENQESIVTLGINPTYPATGYGYIQQGVLQAEINQLPIYKVDRFTEKPNPEIAEAFIKTGQYSWNSGMFIFRAGVILSELRKYAPELMTKLENQGVSAYPQLEKISIDYALMEKTQLASVLPAHFAWDDLGDWNSLERLNPSQSSNIVQGNHFGLDTNNNIIYNNNQEDLLVTIGVEDMVIVRDKNVTLIVPKNRTQDIKKILKELGNNEEYHSLL